MRIRTVAALVLIALAMCAFGAQYTYVGLRDGEQLEITCADYIKKRPDARWLKLTECAPDFKHMAFEEARDHYTAVYLPLRPIGDKSSPNVIVVKRTDYDLLGVVWALLHGEENPPHFDRVTEDLMKPTEGLVQFGLDLEDEQKAQLAGLDLGLAKDFVVIDNGSEPRLAAGIALLLLGVGGLGALGWFLRRELRSRKQRRVVPPTNPLSGLDRQL
jgi:hypothetical protein